jgi:pimeloyl-ACP methyl ester carboxylesterase
MKNSILYKSLLLLFLISTFSACDLNNNDEDKKPVDIYLISYEKHKTYQVSYMRDLLNSYAIIYPELQTITDNLQYSIDVYKITYATKFKGEEIIASGLVSVPLSEGSYPLISYQNGTNTLHSDAPTANPDNQLYLLLEFIASTGFVVAVPDYLGFGASDDMFHPYLEKETTVQAVTDMLRATKEFVLHYQNAEVNKDLYIIGYSQGGWATMQLQKAIEQNYSNEFNLKASSCGAGAYDLNFTNDFILSQETYPMPYYTGYIMNSYIKMGYVTNPAGDLFKSPYDKKILSLFDGKHSGGDINAELTTVVSDLFTEEYRIGANTNPKYSTVISALQKNSVSAWKTNVPTLLTHGTADTYVPVQNSENIYAGFIAAGVDKSKITYIPIEGAGHTGGIIPSGVASFNWFISLNKGN